jgi:hypothetical protein
MSWRKSFQDMEHEHYQHLRKIRAEVGAWGKSDDELRAEAYAYATETCRDAIARWNVDH